MRLLSILVLLLSGGLLIGQATDRSALLSAGAVWQVDAEDYFSVTLPATRNYGPSAKAAANAFLSAHRAALGTAPGDELRWRRTGEAPNGRSYLRFTLYRAGFPVLGREITVAADRAGRVYGVSGTPLSVPSPAPVRQAQGPPAPGNAAYPAGFTAPELAGKYPSFHQWNAEPAGRVWTSANPWDPAAVYALTSVFDVYEPAGYRAERVYLDATGKLVFHHPLHCDLNRELYHINTQNSNLQWAEGDAYPGSLDAEDQEMLTATEETYNLFRYSFGRNGYDGNDGLMRNVTRRAGSCPNASAAGNAVSFCSGVVTDDIVGHEWSHNYTGEMNGLIYAWESGALNEGYADIIGECVDLLNNRGTDTNDGTPRTGCNSGLRWQMGEDATGFGGAIRDMYSPECYNDPSARNSEDYWCQSGDNGGVHINSGVVNRTFSLLVDGGTLNGVTVTGIGMTKALHIAFHAADNYMGRVTDFNAWGMMLEQSAQDLTGINLPALTLLAQPAAASGEIITGADLAQVQNAVNATQLTMPSPCPAEPTLAQNPPDACAAGDNFLLLLDQDWETGTAGWSLTEVPENPGTWDPKPWALNNTLPDGRAGQGLFAPNPRIGDCVGDLDNGEVFLTSPAVTLPADVSDFELRFNHYYSIENNYDGGVLYLSVNGGAFTYLPESAFVYNGYDAALVGPNGNDNPVAGQRAFHGSDAGSTSGTWGTSVVDLTAAGVVPGDDVRIRWSMTHDGCNGWLGWYLDEVRIGYCASAILPVTYTALAATPDKDRIVVSWATEAEEANAGFHVERRAERETQFTQLGFVPAGATYHFDDLRVRSGVNYVYRLRQIDLDGTAHLSDLVAATLAGERPLTVFPNPSRGALTITGTAAQATVYTLDGRLVRTVPLRDNVGEITELARGVYLVRLGREVRRVVVQ